MDRIRGTVDTLLLNVLFSIVQSALVFISSKKVLLVISQFCISNVPKSSLCEADPA